jgi:hypothetical protein
MRQRSCWSQARSTGAVRCTYGDPLSDRSQAVVGSATGCQLTRVTAMGQRAHDDRHPSIHIVNFDPAGLIPTPCDRPTTVSGNVRPERPIRDTHGDDTWPWARRLQQEPHGRGRCHELRWTREAHAPVAGTASESGAGPGTVRFYHQESGPNCRGAAGAAGQGCSGSSGTSVAAPWRKLLPGGTRPCLAQGLDLQLCLSYASADGES